MIGLINANKYIITFIIYLDLCFQWQRAIFLKELTQWLAHIDTKTLRKLWISSPEPEFQLPWKSMIHMSFCPTKNIFAYTPTFVDEFRSLVHHPNDSWGLKWITLITSCFIIVKNDRVHGGKQCPPNKMHHTSHFCIFCELGTVVVLLLLFKQLCE